MKPEVLLQGYDALAFRDAQDAAQQQMLSFVFSGALRIDPDLKIHHPDYIDRWVVHGENHGLLAALYVCVFGDPDSRHFPLVSYIKAGYLHDIGKGESAHPEVWDLPEEKLTKDQQYAKWNHVFVGEQIFARYEQRMNRSLSAVEKEALSQHHERIDGSGGPKGLKGDEISGIGRLFAVIDQVCSRLEGRSRFPAMTLQQAVMDVKQHAGVRYDERIVRNMEMLLSRDSHLTISGLRDLGTWAGEGA